MTLIDIRAPEERLKAIKPIIDNKEGYVKLWQHKKKNGDILIVEIAFSPVNYWGKVASQAQIHDVTEEIKLQEKLEEQKKEEQKNITAAVLKALENDRAHLGAELHDNINQMLATVTLNLEHSLSNIDVRDELINKSMHNIKHVINEIRKLSRTLIVSDISEIGLKKAINEMIANIVLVKKIKISFYMDYFPEKKIDEDLKIAIYRIIQEQLTNILKHANASSIIIELKKEGNLIILLIDDNGKGFDTRLHRKGVGITNMNSRVSLYDGEIKIDSAPGNGCKLVATFKIHK
jgi:signal transduction histidine kinase